MLTTMLELTGLTAADLATLTGKSREQVSKWVNGRSPVPAYALTILEMWPSLDGAGRQRLLGGMRCETKTKPGKSSVAKLASNTERMAELAKQVLREQPWAQFSRWGLAQAIYATGKAGVTQQQVYKRYMDAIIYQLDSKYIVSEVPIRFQYTR